MRYDQKISRLTKRMETLVKEFFLRSDRKEEVVIDKYLKRFELIKLKVQRLKIQRILDEYY